MVVILTPIVLMVVGILGYGYFTHLILNDRLKKDTIPCSTPSRYVSKIEGDLQFFVVFQKTCFFRSGKSH